MTASLPALLVGMIAIWAVVNDSWKWLRVTHAFGSTYADLRQVTATASCIIADPSWTMESATCDPFGRAYNYPSLWARGFAALGLGTGSTEAIAEAFIALFVAALFVISLLSMWPSRRGLPVLGVALAAVAPPTWLALERGNIDVLVFVVVVLAILASIRDKRSASAVLLAVGGLAKIFPAGAGLILLRDREEHPRAFLLFVGLMAFGSAFVVAELPLINRRTPQPTDAAYGAALLFQSAWKHVNLLNWSVAPRLLGIVLFAIVLLAYVALLRFRPSRSTRAITDAIESLARDRIALTLVLAGGGPLIVSYLVGTNFDYRLIFGIPLVAGLGRIGIRGVGPAVLLMGSVIMQMWLTYPVPTSIQQVSDFAWVFVAPAIGLVMLALIVPEMMSKKGALAPAASGVN